MNKTVDGLAIISLFQFASPISQAWVLENGRLKVIDPITHSALIEDSPALYIGMHKQQFYVQESQSTAEKLENAFAIQHARRETSPKSVQIEWKPSSGQFIFHTYRTNGLQQH